MFGDDGYGEPRPGTGIPGLTRTAREELAKSRVPKVEDLGQQNLEADGPGYLEYGHFSGYEILSRIRQSLRARLEGRNEGGDIEVMRLVDELVEAGQRRGYARGMHDHGGRHVSERDIDIDDGC